MARTIPPEEGTPSSSDETAVSTARIRRGALSLALAGILFFLYPVLRPFSDETSLQGAEAFASPFWILAHMLAVVGFILLALSLLGVDNALSHTVARRLASVALVLTWIGVAHAMCNEMRRAEKMVCQAVCRGFISLAQRQ